MTASKMTSPLLAVVVTVLNEGENILPVCREIHTALEALPPTEVIFVDDGSTDDTLQKLQEARSTILPELRILTHPSCLGKSTALRTAMRAARAPWIATMDGDGQDDPAFIQTMLKAALAHGKESVGPLVVGIRRKRQDRLSRKLATRFANGLRQRLLKDDCPDTGGPLKLFRRELFLSLPQFEGLHRFIPALMKSYGAPLICLETRHRPRLHGHSKYTNLHRALVGVRDMLGVLWLQHRTRRPPPLIER